MKFCGFAPCYTPQSAPRSDHGRCISDALQQKLSARLNFYEDIGIDLFYRDRASSLRSSSSAGAATASSPAPESESPEPVFDDIGQPVDIEIAETIAVPAILEDTFQTPRKPVLPPAPALHVPAAPKVVLPAPKAALFDATEKISGDSMLKIRDDIGDCTRCKLHKARNKIVFADGDPKAKLVFVGEGR